MSCLRRKAVGWLGRKGNFWFRAILWPFHQSCTCALAFLHGPGTGTFLRPGLMLQHHYINWGCTRSQLGAGRNRYIRIIVCRKLLYAGSAEDQRNAAPPHNPVRRSFAEKQPGSFPYPALRLNICNFNSIPATDLAEQLDQDLMGPPPHNPVRRSLRYVTGLRGCSHAAQKSKPRLSVAANKSCLQGRTSKIWSCAPAPYGKETHVCAASTGRVLQPVPGAVSALNSSLSEVASLCSTGTAPFFKAIPPHANPQNGARIDEQGKTP